jgi:hypothetical protein
MPELEPPKPPPRNVVLYPDELVAKSDVVGNALVSPPEKPPAPPPTRVEPPKPEPDPPPVAPEPERPANTPALTLKPATGTAQTEVKIRELLDGAKGRLQRVNESALNNDGQAQLRIARRFTEQAEEALKAGNVLLAGKLADKAATMAAVLVR